MTELPPVRALLRVAPVRTDAAVCLSYDQRLLRRRRLETVTGAGFLVDLPEVTNLDAFWGFELADGSTVQVVPAEEPITEVTGDLPRLAWHIGNRHTPCQIESARLVIRHDHVIEAMLRQLGATLRHTSGPFRPEGGAYGLGRTMGHDHAHDHGPAPAHDHGHDHDHDHDHDHHHVHSR
jgi:urease accessory protein